MELFQQIQLVSDKIKVTGSNSLLKDEEYVTLIGNHLPQDIMWKWLESKKTGWTEFYIFLEGSARTAREMLTNESINSAFTAESEKQILGNATWPRLQ